jgi:hypothetical protein
MMPLDAEYRERLSAEAARVRDSGDLGRSDPLIRLFDFLLERSLDGHAPREIEIAQDVFAKTQNFDVMLDASVRVYVHRLRRKLADHYARAPNPPDRLSIPLGEYRLVLESAQVIPDAPSMEGAAPAETSIAVLRRQKHPALWIAAMALVLVNVAAWALFVQRPAAGAAPLSSNLWRPILDSQRPTMVVLGDYYMFGEAPDGVVVSRLVRDFSINSRQDLDARLMLHPEQVGRYSDVDLHYLPVSAGKALRSLLPVVNAAAKGTVQPPPVESMSDVKPEIFKIANIVYVGFLSGLGPLQDPLFRASGFKVGDTFDELVDKTSGRRFKSDWGVVADGKEPSRDYGYIASLMGPSGNRILIIAGTRDPAVVQMAEIAADRQQLDAIDAKSGGGAFEAFYEVRTQGNLNISSSLVLARPIRGGTIWQP